MWIGHADGQPFIRLSLINSGCQHIRRKFFSNVLGVWWSWPYKF
jgi:hypothetical protein